MKTIHIITGVGASGGIGIGPAFVFSKQADPLTQNIISSEEIGAEVHRLHVAKAESLNQLKQLVSTTDNQELADILNVQILMLQDTSFLESISARVCNKNMSVEWAISEVTAEYANMLAKLEDPYIRERAGDVQDMGQRLIRNLIRDNSRSSFPDISCIVVAQDLAPSDMAELLTKPILGLVLEKGSATSHTAILARSRAVPAVMGVSIRSEVVAGISLIVDGKEGIVVIQPDTETKKSYELRLEKQKHSIRQWNQNKLLPARTLDGIDISVVANIGVPTDAEGLLDTGAEGIGLFRTEFLMMHGDSFPTEEEQYRAYSTVLTKLQGHPVVIRTLDIGGDKEVPSLGLEKESNSFLGWRALRMCLDQPELLITQLRAIYRASIHGKARIMFPMVSRIEELQQAKILLAQVLADLDQQGIPYNSNVEVGVMVEVPSAALMAQTLAREVDFFSIGTNDLTQYTLAVDRTNEKVAHLYDPLHPAVIKLISMVTTAAKAHRIWTGLCGELAGDPLATVLLVGLGVEELSMPAPMVAQVKSAIRKLTMEKAAAIADEVLGMGTAQEVRAYLKQSYNVS